MPQNINKTKKKKKKKKKGKFLWYNRLLNLKILNYFNKI